jgi:hypothetical protein
MRQYKIYVIDVRNHITNAHDFEGIDDLSAFDKANNLRQADAAEVWQSTRLVARIQKGGEAAAATG